MHQALFITCAVFLLYCASIATAQPDPQDDLQIKLFPLNPLQQSWLFFEFMPNNRAISQGETISLSAKIASAEDFLVNITCPLPTDINHTSVSSSLEDDFYPFPSEILPETSEPGCSCTAIKDEASQLSPICAGVLALVDHCTFEFTASQIIPQQWLVSCPVNYPKQLPSNPIRNQKLHLSTASTSLWRLSHNTPITYVVDAKPVNIWVDLDIEYEVDVMKDSVEPIDKLTLVFHNLPPNTIFNLEIALDINDESKIDRLMYFPTHVIDMIGDILTMTDFPGSLYSNGARLVNSDGLTTSSGLFVTTGSTPGTTNTFILPIPRNTVIKSFAQQSKVYVDFSSWHNQQIAVYVKTGNSRLFRYQSSDPQVRWDLSQETFHRSFGNFTRHFCLDKNYQDKPQDSTTEVILVWDLVLIGPNPSVQLSDFLRPYLVNEPLSRSRKSKPDNLQGELNDANLHRHYSLQGEFSHDYYTLEQFFKPVEQGGFLERSVYISEPYHSQSTHTFHPLTFYDPTTSTFPIIQFHQNNNSQQQRYHGYANITLAFRFPTAMIMPFGLKFLINAHYPITLGYLNLLLGRQPPASQTDTTFTTTLHLALTNYLDLTLPVHTYYYDNQGGFNYSVSDFHGISRIELPSFAMYVEMSSFLYRFLHFDPRVSSSALPTCTINYFVPNEHDVLTVVPTSDVFAHYRVPFPGDEEYSAAAVISGSTPRLDRFLSTDMGQFLDFRVLLTSDFRINISCNHAIHSQFSQTKIRLRYMVAFPLFEDAMGFSRESNPSQLNQLEQTTETKTTQTTKVLTFTFHSLSPITNRSDFVAFLTTATAIVNEAICIVDDHGAGLCPDGISPFASITSSDWFLVNSSDLYQTLNTSSQYPVSFTKATYQQGEEQPAFSSISIASNAAIIVLALVFPSDATPSPLTNFLSSDNVVIRLVSDANKDVLTSQRAIDFDPFQPGSSNFIALFDSMECNSMSQCPKTMYGSPQCIAGRCRSLIQGAKLDINDYLMFNHYKTNINSLRTLHFYTKENGSKTWSGALKTIIIIVLTVLVGIAMVFATLEGVKMYKAREARKNTNLEPLGLEEPLSPTS